MAVLEGQGLGEWVEPEEQGVLVAWGVGGFVDLEVGHLQAPSLAWEVELGLVE